MTSLLLVLQSVPVRADFTPSGTFDNPETKAGAWTRRGEDKTLSKEEEKKNGVELVYKVGAKTSPCTKIAIIQVVTYVDDKGKVRRPIDSPAANANGKNLEKAASGDGSVVDFGGSEKTPYYNDAGKGDLKIGDLGKSDGHGGGSPAHITDGPTRLPNNWSKTFEAWAVCIEGENVGEVLAGVTWTLDKDGNASITDKKPAAPTKQFKDALKGWEKWYNDGHPGAEYKEPGGGFKF